MSHYSLECPIWGTPAREVTQEENKLKYNDGTVYDSPRAGGKYFLTRTAFALLSSLEQDAKVALTYEIAKHNLSDVVIEINSDNLKKFITNPPLSPFARAIRLLEYFIKSTSFIGQILFFEDVVSNDYIHETTPSNDEQELNYHSLMAISASINSNEVEYLLNILEKSDFITEHNDYIGYAYVITSNGYIKFEDSREIERPDQAFVAMWFDSSMNEIYEKGVRPAIVESGYSPMRIDKKEHVNKIDDEIIGEIRRSRFVIADFTSEKDKPRGGVYFEAGFAYGLNIPVIWTCRTDMINDVHFDTRQYNHITWTDAEDLKMQLENRILAVLGQGPNITS